MEPDAKEYVPLLKSQRLADLTGDAGEGARDERITEGREVLTVLR